MAGGQIATLMQYLRRFLGPVAAGEMSDGQLLERFALRRDEAAFETLVRRFGPMVLGVCRRILTDSHAVEDAFQATFLVLVRKAGAIRKRQLVGNWLYGVAYRTASKARAIAARRRAHERQMPPMTTADPLHEVIWRDLRPVLDEEVNRLPAKYRGPFVLCYLEGHTNEEAARKLGCPCGTVFTRLGRAREMLRGRLARRGVVLSAAACVTSLAQEATAAVPAPLVSSTVKAATAFAAGQATAGGAISAGAAALAEGVLKAMFLSKLKTAALILLMIAVLGTAGATLAYQAKPADPPEAPRDETQTPTPKDESDTSLALAQQSSGRTSGSGTNIQGAGAGRVQGAAFAGNVNGFPGAFGGGGFAGSGFGCGGCTGWGGFGGGGSGFGSGFGTGTGFGRGGGGFGGSGSSGFASCKLAPLTQKPVQQELKLSRDQLKKLEDVRLKQQESMAKLIGSPGPDSFFKPETLFKAPETIQKDLEQLAKDTEKAVDGILTTEQRKRLQEISLQQRGGHALSDPDVAEALKLTEEQRKKIEAIQAEMMKEIQGIALKEMAGFLPFNGNAFDPQKAFAKAADAQKTFENMTKKLNDLCKGASEKLMSVPTTEQKERLKELMGKPFKGAGS